MSFFKVEELSLDYRSLGNFKNVKAGGQVLRQISFEIKKGEIFGILGPTGSGKTVLLKTLAGIIKADSGRVLKNGEDLYRIKPRYRGMSLVFQNYALYPHLTAGKNIEFPLIFKSFKKKFKTHPQARVEEIADLLHLDKEHLLKRKPKNISGGERQRVALGKAIAVLPDLLLLDEPLSNVDAVLRESLRYNLLKLIREHHLTAIYVTHDQREMAFVADRIAVMYEGRILQIGTYSDLYHFPKDYFVSLFVGDKSVNAFDPHTAEELTCGEIKNRFTIRPEYCEIRPLPNSYRVFGKVALVEKYFSEKKILVFIEYASSMVSVLLPMDRHISVGSDLAIYLPKSKIKIF